MASEQATAAAEKIVNGDCKWDADPKEVERVAAIIDAAFAPVVAERDDLRHVVEEYVRQLAAGNVK